MLVAASSTPPHPGATSRSSSPICPRTKLMRTLPNTSPRSSPARSPLVWRRRPSAQGYMPKIPLVSLPCLMHLGIARLVGILGRGRCIDDLRLRDRINDRASRNPQSVGCEVQLHLIEQRPVPCQEDWQPIARAQPREQGLPSSSRRQDASGGSGYVLVNEQDRQPCPWPVLTTLGNRDQAPREAQCGFGEQQARARCRWCFSRDHDRRLGRCSV